MTAKKKTIKNKKRRRFLDPEDAKALRDLDDALFQGQCGHEVYRRALKLLKQKADSFLQFMEMEFKDCDTHDNFEFLEDVKTHSRFLKRLIKTGGM